MSLLWEILQFVLRLSFGVSLAMAITNPRHVTSGFFKVHLWVIMGLNVFGGLVVWTVSDEYLPENLSLIHISEPTRPERSGGGRVWV